MITIVTCSLHPFKLTEHHAVSLAVSGLAGSRDESLLVSVSAFVERGMRPEEIHTVFLYEAWRGYV